MITEKDIKSIPKYLVERIRKQDKVTYPAQDGHLRFYSYLAIWHKELVKVTIAVKNKYKKWHCKQVAVHGLDSKECLVKDLEYNGFIGMGYRVGWHEQGLSKDAMWYETIDWCTANDKYYDPYAPVVNIEVVDKLPEFKYSQFREYNSAYILKFLRLYRQYPQIEYFMKQGLISLVDSKLILKFASKNKGFCKWLVKHKEEIKRSHYVTSIINAYKNNTAIAYEDKKTRLINENKRGDFYQFKQHYFYDFNELIEYVLKQNTSMSSYIDYYSACEYLGLYLGQEKNRLPHNFKHWHDIRTDEYKTAKALADEKERKILYAKFEEIAEKYRFLEHNRKNNFICIIAKSPQDLVQEGEALDHCVGKMNYGQKFVREETLIFFVRESNAPNTPLVTMEYSLKTKTILQCYGHHDTKPSKEILEYVNKKWLPYAKRQTKKLLKVGSVTLPTINNSSIAVGY